MLRALARDDSLSGSAVVRHLIRQRARRRGLWPSEAGTDEERAQQWADGGREMEIYSERFIFALVPVERAALAALARQDRVSRSGMMRRLLRREARRRGLLPNVTVRGEEVQSYEEQSV